MGFLIPTGEISYCEFLEGLVLQAKEILTAPHHVMVGRWRAKAPGYHRCWDYEAYFSHGYRSEPCSECGGAIYDVTPFEQAVDHLSRVSGFYERHVVIDAKGNIVYEMHKGA